VPSRIRCDFNSDGVVNDADLTIVSENAGMTGATWADGDVTGDGQVTEADLDQVFDQIGPQFGKLWDWFEMVA